MTTVARYIRSNTGEWVSIPVFKDPGTQLEFLTLIEVHRAKDDYSCSGFLNRMAAIYAVLYDDWPWDELRGHVIGALIHNNMSSLNGVEDAKLEYVAAVDALSTRIWAGVSYDYNVERVFKDFIKFYRRLFGEDPWEGDYDYVRHPNTFTLPQASTAGQSITITNAPGSLYVDTATGTTSYSISSAWWKGDSFSIHASPSGTATLTMDNRTKPASRQEGSRVNQLGTRAIPPHPASTFAATANAARRRGHM